MLLAAFPVFNVTLASYSLLGTVLVVNAYSAIRSLNVFIALQQATHKRIQFTFKTIHTTVNKTYHSRDPDILIC